MHCMNLSIGDDRQVQERGGGAPAPFMDASPLINASTLIHAFSNVMMCCVKAVQLVVMGCQYTSVHLKLDLALFMVNKWANN